MALHQLHASYILRLEQRLSRLIFELRDVRTGQVWRFDNTKALSGFLDTRITGRPARTDAVVEGVDQAWNAGGTAGRQPAGKGDRK